MALLENQLRSLVHQYGYMAVRDKLNEMTGGEPIKSVNEIAEFLLHQAALRSQENDEAGILLKLCDQWVNELIDLDPHQYGGLANEG